MVKEKDIEKIRRAKQWDKDLKHVEKHINNPLPADLYCKKYNISQSKLNAMIGKGAIKGFSMFNELYVEDKPSST